MLLAPPKVARAHVFKNRVRLLFAVVVVGAAAKPASAGRMNHVQVGITVSLGRLLVLLLLVVKSTHVRSNSHKPATTIRDILVKLLLAWVDFVLELWVVILILIHLLLLLLKLITLAAQRLLAAAVAEAALIRAHVRILVVHEMVLLWILLVLIMTRIHVVSSFIILIKL